MSRAHGHQPRVPSTSGRRTLRWWPLVALTSANYAWQVPYTVHQYGRRWDALAGLGIPLILTGVWFAIAMAATIRGRRGGRTALVVFLVTEVAFYAIHNATGAFAVDMPLSNPVLLIASALGYANTAAAIVYLVLIARARHAEHASVDAARASEDENATEGGN